MQSIVQKTAKDIPQALQTEMEGAQQARQQIIEAAGQLDTLA